MDLKATNADATPDKGGSEKYIRTFAGDMEILQKGGTPDLSPLDATLPAGPGGHTLGQTVPAKPSGPPAPIAAPTPPPVVPKPPVGDPLKTYTSDFTDRMRETHASTATVLAAEQDSKVRAPHVVSESPRNNLPLVIASVVLAVAGIAGISVAYIRYAATPPPVVVAPTVPTPIFVDVREEVSGKGPEIIKAIQASVARPLAPGTVRLLYVATTSADSVFSALAAVSAPNALVRNVKGKGSMAGVININGSQSPFFILSVLSYSDTFAGMLAWEPVMPLYLTDLYPPYPAVQAPAPAVSTTTATTTPKKMAAKPAVSTTSPNTGQATTMPPVPVGIRFFDTTIANHDARVYRDSAGRAILVYGYWNNTTLVIARDTAVFTELIARLATARTP